MSINFQDVADSLYSIAITGSTLQKEQLLRKYAKDVEGFKDILKFIYDPYFTTGLGKKKLDRVVFFDDRRQAPSCEEIMRYLTKYCTGADVDAIAANSFIFSSTNAVWQWAATGLVTKDLQIGVSVTTLNKVFGAGFIPKIGIMRGMHCPPDANGIYLVTEKIDGNRRLIMNKASGPEIYTRSGKRDYGLVEIAEQVRELPLGFVYDTECVAMGEFSDSIELRQASASILNSGGIKKGIKALCFDMLSQVEYDEGRSISSAMTRKARLAGTFGDRQSYIVLTSWLEENNLPKIAAGVSSIWHQYASVYVPNITALPILGIATNKQEATDLAMPIWETGGEGVMMVEHRSVYEVNPNPRKTLLKIKATQEFELKCMGVYEGTNKYEGMLGGVYVEYKGATVGCGSGFPDYLRERYWEHPEQIVGKILEVESFGESRNAQGGISLNCPIFKRIKGEAE